jgi:Tol biopolymer transport system component
MGAAQLEGGGPFLRIELDGSGYVRIPNLVATVEAAPAWAPGSKSFAYTTFPNVSNLGELFVSDSLGNSQRLFPSGTFRSMAYPRYSTDGTWIYFSGQLTDPVYHLWRVHPDGTGAEDLGANLGGGNVDWRSDLSPDDTHLVFTTRAGPWVVRTLDIASRTVSSWSLVGLTARWSPVGDRLAIMPDYDPDAATTMVVANADGTNSHTLTPAVSSDQFDWSPDGQWLVFCQDALLKLIQVDTGLLLPLAWSGGIAQPAWKR